MSRSHNRFLTPTPKSQNEPKIKSKSNVKIEGNIEYTGLEHRKTLRAFDFHCDLQIKIENEKIDN